MRTVCELMRVDYERMAVWSSCRHSITTQLAPTRKPPHIMSTTEANVHPCTSMNINGNRKTPSTCIARQPTSGNDKQHTPMNTLQPMNNRCKPMNTHGQQCTSMGIKQATISHQPPAPPSCHQPGTWIQGSAAVAFARNNTYYCVLRRTATSY